MKPPWPSGRCWDCLDWLLQRLSSTTLLCSSTQRCISGRRQPVRRDRAAAARSGAVTWAERFMGAAPEYQEPDFVRFQTADAAQFLQPISSGDSRRRWRTQRGRRGASVCRAETGEQNCNGDRHEVVVIEDDKSAPKRGEAQKDARIERTFLAPVRG